MKKIIAFILAFIIFCFVIVVYNIGLNKEVEKRKNNLYYWISDVKFNCIEAAKTCLNDKEKESILVLGSSELSSFNKNIFNEGNSNFNMYLMGRGYTQCFQSALSLGAIENETDIKKVVLILSPQWFESGGTLTSEIFSSRFQKNIFNDFLKNSKISFETKKKVINLLKELEVKDEMELKKIERYENAYLKFNMIDRIYLSVIDSISDTKQKRKVIKELEINDENTKNESIKFENYDFGKLLQQAEIQGSAACTNNEFGIYDSYYDTYIKSNIDSKKDSRIKADFVNEKEYEYLKLFLDICNQLEIKPLIINIPVNGRWYDYTGFDQDKRKKYYEKVSTIVKEYNATMTDFSDCEYEKYFLKDIMHLGWKGWIKVDEAIYKYYKE